MIPHARARPPAGHAARRPRRARYRLTGPVVLYPAITYPHKDHAHAARGLRRGCSTGTPTRVLVLPGRRGAERGAPCRRRSRPARGCAQQVRRARPDPRGRRRRAARAGRRWWPCRPATRASASRPSRRWRPASPVVAADATSLPEVVGDAGRARPGRATSTPGPRRSATSSPTPRERARLAAAGPGAGGRASPPRPTRPAFAAALPGGRWPAA